MTHDMRTNPFKFLIGHVIVKRSPKVISIPPGTVLNVGIQNKVERFKSLQVFRQKLSELWRKRYDSFVSIFNQEELFSFSLPRVISLSNVKKPLLQIEPVAPRLDDLFSAEASFKAAEQYEAKFVRRSLTDQTVFQLNIAPILPRNPSDLRDAHLRSGIIDAATFDFNSPAEEGSERHYIALESRTGNRCFLHPLNDQSIMPALDVVRGNLIGSNSFGEPIRKLAKNQLLGVGRIFRKLIAPLLVIDKKLDVVFEALGGMYYRIAYKLSCFRHRFNVVTGLQVRPSADAIAHNGVVIPVSTEVDILHKSPGARKVSQIRITNGKQNLSRFGSFRGERWCAVQDSNLRPPPCQSGDLQSEYHRFSITKADLAEILKAALGITAIVVILFILMAVLP
jgi:hypothetical protein